MNESGMTVTANDDFEIETIESCATPSCECNLRMYSLGGLNNVVKQAHTSKELMDTIC